ncbi:hypothetical protein GGR52DRAFT_511021 [Hypoxylon sp. FL1284]|nr:hypothetical protein GGR52DRAFT_511021 [Hypoxylon sp. FL1284]
MSTADREVIDVSEHNVLVLFDSRSSYQGQVAQSLKGELQKLVNGGTRLVSLADLREKDLTGANITISLLELAATFFRDMHDASWALVKQLTKHCKELFWVASSPEDDEMIPLQGLMSGFWKDASSRGESETHSQPPNRVV